MKRNPWSSYRDVALQTAPRGQLVLMLYEGALRFLERALTGFGHEDPAESNLTISNNILRAQEIIRELDASLDLEQGGEFAATMRRLYDYFDRRLHESNLQKQTDGIREVTERLNVLREAWATMLRQQAGAVEAQTPIAA